MSFLDFLQESLTVGTQGVNARNEGQRLGMLDALKRQQDELERQQAAERERRDAQRFKMELRRGKVGETPSAETFGVPVEAVGPDGQPVFLQRGNRGTLTPVEGYRPITRSPSATPRNIDPLSPQGIERATERERAIAAVRAETGDRSIARPTESQEKSFLYGQFMRDALPTIDALAPRANGRAISFALGRGVEFGEDLLGPGALTGDILSDADQQLINAARMFTAGLLRKESGAAITPAELRDTFQRFIPLGSDSPTVAAQKKRNRALAESVMQDLALPAEEYYRRVRAIGNGGAATSVTPNATPATPAVQPPPDFAAWQASRRRTP